MTGKKYRHALDNLVKEADPRTLERLKWREENEYWLDIAFEVGIDIITNLRENKEEGKKPSNAKELAQMSELPEGVILKILQGTHNSDLKVLGKIKKVL